MLLSRLKLLRKCNVKWSGWLDSNQRQPRWQRRTLPLSYTRLQVVPTMGLEPATYGLQNRCSTNWATSAYLLCSYILLWINNLISWWKQLNCISFAKILLNIRPSYVSIVRGNASCCLPVSLCICVNNSVFHLSFLIKICGSWYGSRTRKPERASDFKSDAYTNSANQP